MMSIMPELLIIMHGPVSNKLTPKDHYSLRTRSTRSYFGICENVDVVVGIFVDFPHLSPSTFHRM